MVVTDIHAQEYGAFYAGYLSRVPSPLTLSEALTTSGDMLLEYLYALDPEHADYAYAPDKWTIAQALQHLIDTERIFAYRSLRLGRRDSTPLPGFDQDEYAARADLTHRRFPEMIGEFAGIRQSTVTLFASFTEADLSFIGTASGYPISCRAMGFIIAGHTFHHQRIYVERYGHGKPANAGEENTEG
ncbi:DinB family protein [Neolewinella xylanilytica]|uniref:DinB family protein n=1 Tax=Neolewinella xylanilytica TaxID=1514080 RepID=A0A2S6HZZ2_9BACT|nr:DinB family protein [Neolewinella xylanilytica]PPK84093.1 DinB family protein [Neolewinella xylanilytica]